MTVCYGVWLFPVGRGSCSRGCALLRTATCALAAAPLWAAFFELRRASMALLFGRGIWLRQEGNLRDEPQARRQRLPAAAEACDVVLRARGQDSSISQLAEEQM